MYIRAKKTFIIYIKISYICCFWRINEIWSCNESLLLSQYSLRSQYTWARVSAPHLTKWPYTCFLTAGRCSLSPFSSSPNDCTLELVSGSITCVYWSINNCHSSITDITSGRCAQPIWSGATLPTKRAPPDRQGTDIAVGAGRGSSFPNTNSDQ